MTNTWEIGALQSEIVTLKKANEVLAQQCRVKDEIIQNYAEKIEIAEHVMRLSPNRVKKELEISEQLFARLKREIPLSRNFFQSIKNVHFFAYYFECMFNLSQRDLEWVLSLS